MIRLRLRLIALAALVAALSLAGCANPGRPATTTPSQPVDAPAATLEEIDVAVRRVLQDYLDALKRGSYAEAAGYWSPAAKASAEALQAPGVTDWYFISSEMIDATPSSAYVQLSFAVTVAPGTATDYSSGRNTRFVRLALEQGGWKIQSFTSSP